MPVWRCHFVVVVLELGLLRAMPRMEGIKGKGSSFMASAFNEIGRQFYCWFNHLAYSSIRDSIDSFCYWHPGICLPIPPHVWRITCFQQGEGNFFSDGRPCVTWLMAVYIRSGKDALISMLPLFTCVSTPGPLLMAWGDWSATNPPPCRMLTYDGGGGKMVCFM